MKASNPLKYSSFFITLLLTVFSQQLIAAHSLPEFNANYSVEKYGIKVAEANYQLNHTATGYKFTQNTELHGFASMFANDSVSAVSYVDETKDHLLLKKYKYIQTGRKKNRNEEFSISWDTSKDTLNGIITGVVRSKKINLATDSEVWEALSFQLPLMIEAKGSIKEYPYKAILKGKIDTYNFVLTSTKKIDFANKEYLALQMVRKDLKKNKELHIWLLPELNNVPVLIETYRKGKEDSRIILESVQFNDNAPLVEQKMDDDDDF